MKIGIVILNYNGEKDTIKCLESIQSLNKKDSIEVIVVDNGSKEPFQKSPSLNLHITVIYNDQNLGFSQGNNKGIKKAIEKGASHVLILNNDTIIDKNLIRELLSVADSDDRVGIVVPKIYFEKGYEFHKDRYSEDEKGKVIWYAGGLIDWNNVIGFHRGVDEIDHGQYNKAEETEFATGCCMLVKTEIFKKVGFLDPAYFLYYEDSDFSKRVQKAGYRILFVPKAILWHKNAASAGGSGSSLQDYYIARNRLLFGMRYAPLEKKAVLLKESLSLLLRGRNWQKRGIIDFYLGRLGKGSYSEF